MADQAPLFARKAELLRELAILEEAIGAGLDVALKADRTRDEALSLPAAAALMGEPAETFRRRVDYRLLGRPGERRLRYSRSELERIRRDRLAGNVAG